MSTPLQQPHQKSKKTSQMITTRKFKLAIVSDNRNEAYSFIRNEIRNQNKALNAAYNHLYFEHIATEKLKHSDEEYQKHLTKYREVATNKYQDYLKVKEKVNASKDDEKLQKRVDKAREAYNKAQEKVYKIEKEFNKKSMETYQKVVGLSKQTRIGKLLKSQFTLHYDTEDRITSTVLSHFNNDMKTGVLRGDRSLRTYKNSHPLLVRARSMKVYEENGDYFIKWVKGIVFKIVISAGSKQKANIGELKSVLINILNGHYKVCDSSISLNKDLILNLSLNIPVSKENVFVPGRVVGVDLGLKIPAYVSLNDTPYIKKGIGNIDDFLNVRTQLQNQRKRLQKTLECTSGGKGRSKKLKGLDRLKAKEKNFVNTYNHFLSKKIIQFAVKNNAGVIHLEELQFDKLKHKSLLRNWSYYQLQTMIEYKAEREGIEVKYVDASYTSQTCSKCGHYEEGQRVLQDTFTCKNKECKGYVHKVNADFNASQNIAKSTDIIRCTEMAKNNDIEKNA
ncbi:transposase [Priestia megaterium]